MRRGRVTTEPIIENAKEAIEKGSGGVRLTGGISSSSGMESRVVDVEGNENRVSEMLEARLRGRVGSGESNPRGRRLNRSEVCFLE
jgi:hypothetical protein